MTEPRTEAGPLTDAEKLRALAVWFDTWDSDRAVAAAIFRGTGGGDEVQRDLRRMADDLEARAAERQRVEALEEALREIAEHAEADDDFEGEFLDYLVPFEYIEKARALLASPAPEPRPAPLESADAVIEAALEWIRDPNGDSDGLLAARLHLAARDLAADRQIARTTNAFVTRCPLPLCVALDAER